MECPLHKASLSGEQRAGYIRTTRVAGSSGIVAIIWAAATQMTRGKSKGGKIWYDMSDGYREPAVYADHNPADPANAKHYYIGLMMGGNYSKSLHLTIDIIEKNLT